jgi:hypothetical protein
MFRCNLVALVDSDPPSLEHFIEPATLKVRISLLFSLVLSLLGSIVGQKSPETTLKDDFFVI